MIYKSNLTVKNPLVIDKYEVRLASYILNVSAGELNALLLYAEEVTDRKATSIKESKQIVLLQQYYQVFEDSTFLINTPRRDWFIVGYIYILSSKIPYDVMHQQIVRFATFASERMAVTKKYKEIQSKVKDMYIQMARLYSSKDKFLFFNHKEFAKACKESGIEIVFNEHTILMQWKDVEITDARSQVLYYTRIELIVRIPDFYISRFMMSTHGFRYDSEYDIDLPLHPNLNKMTMLYWGKNNFLEFLPVNDYKAVVNTLDELIRGANPFYQFNEVIENLKKLSILWQDMDKGLDYNTRSKLMFEQIKGENK